MKRSTRMTAVFGGLVAAAGLAWFLHAGQNRVGPPAGDGAVPRESGGVSVDGGVTARGGAGRTGVDPAGGSDPLTISDAYSRYLHRCRSVEKSDGPHVRAVFEAVFREYGLPDAIRQQGTAQHINRLRTHFRIQDWQAKRDDNKTSNYKFRD